MISCIATLPLPGNVSGGIPLHESDPLHKLLQEKYNIQIRFGLGNLQKEDS